MPFPPRAPFRGPLTRFSFTVKSHESLTSAKATLLLLLLLLLVLLLLLMLLMRVRVVIGGVAVCEDSSPLAKCRKINNSPYGFCCIKDREVYR